MSARRGSYFVRIETGREHELRACPPIDYNHPAHGFACPACGEPFQRGDIAVLVALGPGRDKEEQARCLEGQAYNAVAIVVHALCAGLRGGPIEGT